MGSVFESRMEGTLMVRQELLNLLPKTEALIFDIDGVLVDASESYRLAVCEAVKFFVQHELGWVVDAPPLTPDEVDMFKKAGGFNNDWDLTQAAALFLLFKSLKHGVKRISALKRLRPSLEEFLAEVSAEGGGLSNAEKAVIDKLELRQRRDLARLWKRRLLVQLAQEFYAGRKWCPRLFGFEPQHVDIEFGFLERERTLIELSLLPKDMKLGILTGRAKRETMLALERVGLLPIIPEEFWVTDDDPIRKPDPKALTVLMEKLGANSAIYIGDTIDDLQMVNDYKANMKFNDPKVWACMTLTGPNGEKNRGFFLEQGADIIATDINALLGYLNHARKRLVDKGSK
ncbi:MAG: HAD-IA family hydrolase [Armatimonadetes bacterium]|nr:HAD-IA family hydrolase [Armatimonadota bacterium]MCX7968624.1 HAD-IA family hydrolase [Armatimonadota bacterium]MDW8142293.1 HAD-IA family hydrolase [Armatimonadota bacterium]